MIKEFNYEFNWNWNPMNNNELIKITIHYDELFNDNHEMELAVLATSWQGLAKMLSNVGELALYGKITKDSSSISVTTKATLTKGSVVTEIFMYVKDLGLLEGSVPAIVTPILAWLFQRKSINKLKEEITQLRTNSESNSGKIQLQEEQIKALKHDVENQTALIEKQAAKLNSPCRAFLSPIGKQCNIVECIIDNKTVFKANEETKQLFESTVITLDDQEHDIVLVKLNKNTGSCNIAFDYENKKYCIPATINDFRFNYQNNDYLDSFANRYTTDLLRVKGQLILNDEGEPQKFIIHSVIKKNE